MDNNSIATYIANIHNTLSEISVRGDDVIRMANVLQTCRKLVKDLYGSAAGADANAEEKQ